MPKRKKSSDKHAPQARRERSVPSALPLGVLAGIAIIALAAFIVYLPSLSGAFIMDDDSLLTENIIIKASNGLYWFWCTTDAPDYWPVTYTTLWIEWRLWGMNTTGYRVINLILHIVESLLIWIVLRKLSIPGAFLAAMVFAVHPLNVESVAWISQRKDLLAMLFFLLSILWYLKAETPAAGGPPAQNSPHQPGVGRWYWLSLAAFVLAMLSKGSVAVLPVLLLGIVWWHRGTVPIFVSTKMGLSPSVSISRRDLVRTAPFFLTAVALTEVNLWFQTKGTEAVVRTAGFVERLLGAGSVVWFYLYKALLPIDLAFIYPQWRIETGNFLWWLPLLAALIVSALLWRYRESRCRPLAFAWGFFCAALIPVMGFTDVGFMKYSLVADHYQHIAMIGVIALAAALWSVWHQRARGGAHWAAAVVAVAAVGFLSFMTCRQSGLYRDEITLYQDTLRKNPACWIAHYNLGNALAKVNLLQEAAEHYRQVLQLNPYYTDAHNNLGAILAQTNRQQEAIEYFQQALRLKPDYTNGYYNLGNAYKAIGQYQQAIEYYEKSLRLKPNDPEAHDNMGAALVETGRYQEAIEHFKQAFQLKPDYTNACNDLALTYARMHQPAEAVAAARKALELARAEGQIALAKQIEDWLNSYRANLSDLPNAPSSSQSVPPP